MINIEEEFLSLPISIEARNIARTFASQQPFSEVAERVKHNTLAVLVTRCYLEMMGIATNLETSDSWNPIVQMCADVADLEIAGLDKKLECRSLQLGESTCYVPPEVWEDRLGYVVVRFEENLRSATLLGFVSKVSTEFIALNRLEPIENLCVAIAALRESNQQNSGSTEAIVSLSNWLKNLFESRWQEIENLLDSKQSQYAYRTKEISKSLLNNLANSQEIRRGILFELGVTTPKCLLALITTISPKGQNEIDIRLSLYPISEAFLPELIELVVLDDAGNEFLKGQARSIDNYINIQFSGRIGERFSVRVSLDDNSLTENFTI
ncbi:MAG: hypothetical protein DCF19_19340 [Pseudanabaena frigida]|uniref:DUF1822 domain-containing protein n=1 Tax=Pseudanabaena frigida TaxID=945775 RepID=A0A2W4W540_9CYAN|nr:MAG: hypothetical protein DCF19_19340 [Pseudanabaena frigida]